MMQKPFSLKPESKPVGKYSLIVIPVLFIAVVLAMLVQILVIGRGTRPERRFLVEGNNGYPEVLSLSLAETIFQDSRIINLRLEAVGRPIRFDVSLESEDRKTLLPVYSAPVPYGRENEGKKIIFFLGEYPPNPLALEIVLPLEFEGLLKTQVVYNEWDPVVDPAEKPDTEDYIFVVTKSRRL